MNGGLSTDRTLLILSGNSIEHALLALAAMYAGVPYAPAAPAYSLLVNDHSTLGKLVETMRPGLIFAGDGVAFEPALRDVAGASIEVVTSTPPRSLRATPAMELETIEPTGAVDDAHARVNARDGGEGALHVGIHRASQGRHQHAAHAVLEPGTDLHA